MTTLRSVDPGLNAVGWAYWYQQRLTDAGLSECVVTRGRTISDIARTHGANMMPHNDDAIVVVEEMEYFRGAAKSQPEDLLRVAYVGGYLGALLRAPNGEVHFVKARDWKGQVPKPVMALRICGALDDREQHVLNQILNATKKSLRHNVLDAVGIGLSFLGRLPK